MVAMRDGVRLATDVHHPRTDGRSPAILVRTPYGRRSGMALPDLVQWCDAGYRVVIQDTRGRYDSEGSFRPYLDEADDGVDAVEWVASQAWSDGTVALVGSSYGAALQWAVAARRPAGLGAIVPRISPGDLTEGYTRQGGVPL